MSKENEKINREFIEKTRELTTFASHNLLPGESPAKIIAHILNVALISISKGQGVATEILANVLKTDSGVEYLNIIKSSPHCIDGDIHPLDVIPIVHLEEAGKYSEKEIKELNEANRFYTSDIQNKLQLDHAICSHILGENNHFLAGICDGEELTPQRILETLEKLEKDFSSINSIKDLDSLLLEKNNTLEKGLVKVQELISKSEISIKQTLEILRDPELAKELDKKKIDCVCTRFIFDHIAACSVEILNDSKLLFEEALLGTEKINSQQVLASVYESSKFIQHFCTAIIELATLTYDHSQTFQSKTHLLEVIIKLLKNKQSWHV